MHSDGTTNKRQRRDTTRCDSKNKTHNVRTGNEKHANIKTGYDKTKVTIASIQ